MPRVLGASHVEDGMPPVEAQLGAINDYCDRMGWLPVDVIHTDDLKPSDRFDAIVGRAHSVDAKIIVAAINVAFGLSGAEWAGALDRCSQDKLDLAITAAGFDTTTETGRAMAANYAEGRTLDIPHCDRPAPPMAMIYRVTGTYDFEQFDLLGHVNLTALDAALSSTGKTIADFDRILDFGCGCGRLLRRMLDLNPDAEYSAVDIDQAAISWVSENLRPKQALVVGEFPPIPVADNSFDLAIGFSVFTHLDEVHQDAWLKELARVVEPGGNLLLTVSGSFAWGQHSATALRGRPERESLEREISEEGLAFWEGDGWEEHFPDFYHTAFHDIEYVKRHWSQFFDSVDVIEAKAPMTHDVVLLRSP